jgi:circadian clock protein KaiB
MKLLLKLFVTGRTPRSERAIYQLRRLCETELKSHACEIVIVDVLEEPEAAEANRILATPTLIKQSPPPVRRIIGDLADTQGVLSALGLWVRAEERPKRDRP